jgi:hypothetical protein
MKQFIPAPNKLNYISKRSLLLRDKIFNNLPVEIKNVADNFKKSEIALNQFLYTYFFIFWKYILINHKLCIVFKKCSLYRH